MIIDVMQLTHIPLNEALAQYPALGAESASDKTSAKYRFISTKDILTHLDSEGWKIQAVRQANGGTHAGHRVSLVSPDTFTMAESALKVGDNLEGFPRVDLFNSHNRSKRFMMVAGYFRVVCENGLISTYGPTEKVKTVHRFSDDRMALLKEAIAGMIETFPLMNQKILDFKDRTVTRQEQEALAAYALETRFIYREKRPTKFSNALPLLNVRRPEDEDLTLWNTFNVIQENLFRGQIGYSRPINSYLDETRLNQELWTGAELGLGLTGDAYDAALRQIITDKREKMAARRSK